MLAYADKMMPAYNVPVNFMSGGLDYAAAYAEIGNKAKAKQMLGYVVKNAEQYANWYLSLSQDPPSSCRSATACFSFMS